MSDKKLTCLLSLDISAAFDALNHDVLLDRASCDFGIRESVLLWLRSYLSGRTMSTVVNGEASAYECVSSGVPQGSTLGPLLFSLYISPVGLLIERAGAYFHQYADDTQLYISVVNVTRQLQVLAECAEAVKHWFLSNDLMLNASKTECVVFGTGARLNATVMPSFAPFKDTPPVTISDKIKLLGVILDNRLSMTNQVDAVIKSCNYHIRALKVIRPTLTDAVANMIACSTILTRLDGCNSLLYGAPDGQLDRLQLIQNRTARIVCRKGGRCSAAPLLRSLHWLPIRSRINFKMAVITYNAVRSGQPGYLADLIKPLEQRRTLRSTGQDLLHVPPPALASSAPSFSHAAPNVWNSLPLNVKSAENIITFRKRLKTHYMSALP